MLKLAMQNIPTRSIFIKKYNLENQKKYYFFKYFVPPVKIFNQSLLRENILGCVKIFIKMAWREKDAKSKCLVSRNDKHAKKLDKCDGYYYLCRFDKFVI